MKYVASLCLCYELRQGMDNLTPSAAHVVSCMCRNWVITLIRRLTTYLHDHDHVFYLCFEDGDKEASESIMNNKHQFANGFN